MSNRGRAGPPRGGGGPRGGGSPRGIGSPRGGGSPRGRGSSPSSSGRSTPERGRGGPGRGYEPRGRGGYDGGRGGGGGVAVPRGASRGRGMGGPVIFAENVPALPHPRLHDNIQQQLIASFKSLKVEPGRPLRPGYGTVGTPITLRANFFPIKVPKGSIYDYEVDISPKTDINCLKIRIFQLLELSPLCQPHLPYIAHDRSERLVSARKLPQPLDIQVPFYDDGEPGPRQGATVYIVSIKLRREIDTGRLVQYMDGGAESRDYDPLPLVSALNLVLQQHASRTGVRIGQKVDKNGEKERSGKNKYFFPTSEQQFSIGTGITAVQGFFISVRPAFKQLMVNVNVCMAAFVKPGNLADALYAFNQNSRGAMPTLPDSFVKSIKVKTQHLGHRKSLFSIGTTSARNTYVDIPEFGGRISADVFFKRKYNIQLKHSVNLPVVNLGNKNKTVWVPAELCDIEPGSVYRGTLGQTETAQMIRYACNPPKVNAEAIVNRGFPILGLSSAKQPITGFNISIDTEMAVVPGRELRPPQLTYHVGQARVQSGSWNILDVKFHHSVSISSWWVLVIKDGPNIIQGPDDQRLRGLISDFDKKLRNSGISMPPGLPRLLPPANLQGLSDDPNRRKDLVIIRDIIKTALNKARGVKPGFILVLLENRDNHIYPGIKRIGDVELGIQTIHMQLVSKALQGDPKKKDQYFSNVALKVNTKLGGMNHLLDNNAMRWLTKKKTMVVGIDVTHPSPGSIGGTPSIAAVVASVDDSFMLDELRDMLVERLQVYEKKNKAFPARVFIYRDGVSEGQFDSVLREELAQVLEAFKKVSPRTKYRPDLSIIICGKRHHARFYPTNSALADRNGNTRPGTVVDKGVTGVFDFDFYLQAHAGLQGTVKATHYTVVYDENGLTADEVQQGTHDASYLYARATKAVSLIPAAYYADLACERGRCYLNDFFVDNKRTTSARSKLDRKREEARVLADAKSVWGEGLHPDMRESMFYI